MSDESRRPDMQSFVDTFQCPPSQQVPPPPQKKAKRRRKRHVPPGPAGVWFQSQQHHHQEQEEHGESRKDHQHELPAADVSSCPAWMCMQASLQLCTPYLPPYLSVQQRYQQLRPCIPSNYLLIPELHGSLSSHKKLLVLVHASAVQYHEYWTVECKDECGATLQAWMDPEFDEKTFGGLLQMGVVWLLRDLRFMVGETTRQPWLLVSRDNIERAWTPQQASHDFSDLQYVEWMTRRSHLPLQQQQQHEEEPSHADMEDDEEQQTMERRTNDDEEEEEDDSVLVARTSFQVVSPHPSAGRRSSHPSSVQQRPTPHLPTPGRSLSPAAPSYSGTATHREVNHVSAPAGHSSVRRELHRTPSHCLTTDSRQDSNRGAHVSRSDRNEDTNRVNANMFSEFQSPSASKSPTGQVSASRANAVSTSDNQSRRDRSLTPPNRGEPSTSTTSTLDTAAPATTVTADMFSQFSAPLSVDTTKRSRNRVSFSQAHNKSPPSNHTPVAVDLASAAQQRIAPAAPKSVQTPAKTENARPSHSKVTENDTDNKSPVELNARSAVASDFLSQFTAVSARELTQQQSPTTKSPNKRLKISKKKATPTTDEPQQNSPKSPGSPKLPSKLWQCADTAMLGMFDEEEEDDGMLIPSQPPAVAPAVDSASLDSNPEPSSLFQASAYAGMNVDDLFDED